MRRDETYLFVVEAVKNKAQDLGHLVQLPVKEAFLGEFVVHLRAELLDALGVPIRQVGGMLALEELDNLVQVHVSSLVSNLKKN